MSQPVIAFETELPGLVLAQLKASEPAPAWVIDIARGLMLAANAAGAALLGLRGATSAPVLDASTPALVRLRALGAEAARRPDNEVVEPLVFWARSGAVRRSCRVQFVHAGSLALAVVIATTAEPRVGETPVLFAGDDAAKLKEIARRIREGQKAARVGRKRPQNERSPPVPSPSAEVSPTGTSPSAALPSSLRSALAHELKTPLSAIAAAAEIMKDQRFGPLEPRYAGYAADIHGSARHVLAVIERMLAEAGGGAETAVTPLDFTEIDAGAMLEGSVSQLAPLAERAGITLALELAPRLPRVIADVTSLQQIVLNLLTNALKFTARGGRVTVGALYSGDGQLKIAVSDTGCGMTRRQVERLLAPGRALKPDRRGSTSEGGGLGLGLPLVQALAAANGAELLIESAPGKGTSAAIVFSKDRVIPV